MFSKIATISLLATASAKSCVDECQRAEAPHDKPIMVQKESMMRKQRFWEHMKMNNKMGVGISQGVTPCVNGMAGIYPCSGM